MVDKTDFELTAEKAERLAYANMRLYKIKVLLYAILGYVVIFAVLFGLLGLTVGMVALASFSTLLFLLLLKKKIIFVLLPVIWMLTQALWIRLEAPKGYVLSRDDFPELFKRIDKLQKKLKTPTIHQVILTPELNAAVNQTPRLGIFGWYKNTLILGLELLLTLSPKQAEAVLAHELGHLSGNHSRFNAWVYRVRSTWYRIMVAFEQTNNWGAMIMKRFFNWYAPRFAAYSFTLARMNEYEADTISAELTSVDTAGAALVNTYVSAPYVDEHYWETFFKQADEAPKPKHRPWLGLRLFLHDNKQANEALAERLKQALSTETSYDDTHPALRDRLDALDTQAVIPEPVTQTAAEAWLGKKLADVLRDFDADWLKHNLANWQQRYEYVQESKQRLAELQNQANETLNDEQLWDKARLSEEFDSDEAAFPLFQAYQQRNPDDPDAAFVLGRLLFEKNDNALLEQMRIALNRPALVIDACRYAYYHLARNKREAEAQWWRERAEAQMQVNAEAEAERAELHPDDRIVPIELSKEQLAPIVKVLRLAKQVKNAWVAQKMLQHYSEVPALAIVVVFKWWVFDSEKASEKISEELDLDCTYYVVPRTGDYQQIADKVILIGTQIV